MGRGVKHFYGYPTSPWVHATVCMLRAILSAFRTFVRFVLVWICRFPLPLGVWEGMRFVIVALPGLFSYPFFFNPITINNFASPFFLINGWSAVIANNDTDTYSGSVRHHRGLQVPVATRCLCRVLIFVLSKCLSLINFGTRDDPFIS